MNAPSKLRWLLEIEAGSEQRSVEQQHRDAASPLLSREDAGRYRSLCMRAAYLAQDRMGIAEATKTLARNMASPNEASWRLLKRLGRYLKKHPNMTTVYMEQDVPEDIKI